MMQYKVIKNVYMVKYKINSVCHIRTYHAFRKRAENRMC